MRSSVPIAILLAGLAAGLYVVRAAAQCPVYALGLNDAAEIVAAGGSFSGAPAFGAGVNGAAVAFNGNTHVTFPNTLLTQQAGAVAFWLRLQPGSNSGGVWQLGEVGGPSSLGLFYLDGAYLCFEARGAGGTLAQACAGPILAPGVWTHVAGVWQFQGTGIGLWLYVNGLYVAYAWLPGNLGTVPSYWQLGRTGYYEHMQGAVDELRFFDRRPLDGEVWGELVYSAGRFVQQPVSKPPSTGPVRIVGRHFEVDGRPFVVKGVGYAPTPVGQWPDYPVFDDMGILARDIPLLRGLHVNTVRTWGTPPNRKLLDVLYYNGDVPIYTLVGFWAPISGVDYSDPATIAYYEGEFRAVVNRFKDHPGLLAWGLGNEVNLYFSGPALMAWYAFANRLAEVAYEEEGPAYHPCVLVNGDLRGGFDTAVGSDDASLDMIDVWGVNTYFGWDAHCYFDYARNLTARPLLFTEYGIDAFDNRIGATYLDIHAAWVVHQWRQIETGCAGGSLMAYCDEWWKAGDPPIQDPGGYATDMHPDGYSNEEWWGLFAAVDNGNAPDTLVARPAYFGLADEYQWDPGDADADDDVDLADALTYQACAGHSAAPCGPAFDFDADGQVAGGDLHAFAACSAGPARPPACPE